PLEINELGQLGVNMYGNGINYLGNTDQYLEMVFRDEEYGTPDNVDRFYHNLADAQAAYNEIVGYNGGSFTYTQTFLDSQLAKSPIYNIHQVGGEWIVQKIEFDGAGYA